MKKVLFTTDVGFLKSGYGRYSYELFQELHKHCQLAELAVNVSENNNELVEYRKKVPWKVYSGLPSNPKQQEEFNKVPLGHFGAWAFEYACLDFTPSHCLDVRDFWNFCYQSVSPFRRFYKHILMPAVDGEPQQPQWLDVYKDTDAVLTYTEWGKNVLDRQSHGRINTVGVAPAIPPDCFKPTDVSSIKSQFGGNSIITTVMRNQSRKLFDDIIRVFNDIKNKYGKPLLLHLHTNPIDGGNNIIRMLHEHGVADSVLFTYKCRQCNQINISKFNGMKISCKCGSLSEIAGTGNGVSEEQMGLIYNLADVCLQVFSNGGQEMPAYEAAACGTKVVTAKWTGQEDLVNKFSHLGVFNYEFFTRREIESGRYFAHPKKESLVDTCVLALNATHDKEKLSQAVRQEYNREKIAKVWIDAINSVEPALPWNSPPRIIQPQKIPQTQYHSDWVRQAIVHYLQMPELIGSFFEKRMIRDLNDGLMRETYGTYFHEQGFETLARMTPFNREEAIKQMNIIINKNNHWEKMRWEKFGGR